MFDFDTPIDRRDTHSLKYDAYAEQGVIPMWIADMDFRSPEPVLDALTKQVQHGIFGYSDAWGSLTTSVVSWIATQHGWRIEPEWLVWLPGVVPGFNAVNKAFCTSGKATAIQTPNYPPLLKAPETQGAKRLDVKTIKENGRWAIDFQSLEDQLKQPDCTLFILCNPMNPCGTALTLEELQRIATLCEDHGVMLCSDEIHCDLVLEASSRHIPMGSIYEDTITLMSGSKTFNFAGLSCAFAIIPNQKIREQFVAAGEGIMSWPSSMGYLATEAAFTHGHAWHRALLNYLRANRDEVVLRVNAIGGQSVISPQATFMAWIDCSALGQDPYEYFLQAGIAPSAGKVFGAPDFVRLNFACSNEVLDLALTRLEAFAAK